MALRLQRSNLRNILMLLDEVQNSSRNSATTFVQLWNLKNHLRAQGIAQIRRVSSTSGFHNIPQQSKIFQNTQIAHKDGDKSLEQIATDFFRGNDHFAQRHIGPREEERNLMLEFIGCEVSIPISLHHNS